jgi:NAD(P)-dependent dehydrogenase (short-subunit alcohol dehydrogenase family)
MKTLEGKVVVITGAGSGIGRALTVECARRGALVAISDVNEEGLAETARLAGAKKHLAKRVDVRSDDEVGGFAADVERTLGGASVVVNNAGVSLSDTIGPMKRADFAWLMDINFWGVVRGTEAFLPQLQAQSDAHVVNISSVFGLIAVPSQSAYNASKFAVRGYTEALRQELAESHPNVHVTCVHPGGIRTNIVRNGRTNRDMHGKPVDRDRFVRDFDRMARTSSEQAAEIILEGVLANRPRVLVGGDAHVIDWMQRMFPVRYPSIMGAISRWMERANGRSS